MIRQFQALFQQCRKTIGDIEVGRNNRSAQVYPQYLITVGLAPNGTSLRRRNETAG